MRTLSLFEISQTFPNRLMTYDTTALLTLSQGDLWNFHAVLHRLGMCCHACGQLWEECLLGDARNDSEGKGLGGHWLVIKQTNRDVFMYSMHNRVPVYHAVRFCLKSIDCDVQDWRLCLCECADSSASSLSWNGSLQRKFKPWDMLMPCYCSVMIRRALRMTAVFHSSSDHFSFCNDSPS